MNQRIGYLTANFTELNHSAKCDCVKDVNDYILGRSSAGTRPRLKKLQNIGLNLVLNFSLSPKLNLSTNFGF